MIEIFFSALDFCPNFSASQSSSSCRQSSPGFSDILASQVKARVGPDDFEAFFGIKGRKGGIHAKSLNYDLKILFMLVYISFQIELFDITHVDSFVHGEREIVFEDFNFIRADPH